MARRRSRVFVAALVAAGALVVPATAGGAFTTNQWEYASCATLAQNAPVNIVFYGNATSATSLTLFTTKFPTWTSMDATSRYFKSAADCGVSDWRRASAPSGIAVGAKRYMIQARHTCCSDVKLGQTMVAAVRLQTKKPASCLAVNPAAPGISSGYDKGRAKLYTVLLPVPNIGFSSSYWGNTATVHQCDGTDAGSNGYVFWFRVT
jgi:hypothetical protein